ncbi:MAG: malonic semialdehyde reductase [Paracoccaceae bacterium]|nr:malonic semialdehyde reductase [Paracoccaceae bacterium]
MTENTDQNTLRETAMDEIRSLRGRIDGLNKDQLDLILTGARSHYAWTDKPVSDALLHEIFDITKMGPTSMNCGPARFTFVRSAEGKERLVKSLKPANVPKVMNAPITAIIAYDVDFWRELLRLFPHDDRRGHFRDKAAHAQDTAYRNSTLQGAYFMIAARALGLDVGAISGFSNAVVDEEFFAGTTVKSNFLCNIGYADETALFQRLPRFDFDDVCNVI